MSPFHRTAAMHVVWCDAGSNQVASCQDAEEGSREVDLRCDKARLVAIVVLSIMRT